MKHYLVSGTTNIFQRGGVGQPETSWIVGREAELGTTFFSLPPPLQQRVREGEREAEKEAESSLRLEGRPRIPNPGLWLAPH